MTKIERIIVVAGMALGLTLVAAAVAPAADRDRGCTGTETDHGSLACDPICNALGNCNRP